MHERGRRWDLKKQQYWQDLLERQQRSGQSVRAFCIAAGIRPSALYRWRCKLAGRGCEADAGPNTAAASHAPTAVRPRGLSSGLNRFLPMRVVPDEDRQEHSRRMEIVLAGGHSVRLEPGFDPQTLTEVLDVLEARPC